MQTNHATWSLLLEVLDCRYCRSPWDSLQRRWLGLLGAHQGALIWHSDTPRPLRASPPSSEMLTLRIYSQREESVVLSEQPHTFRNLPAIGSLASRIQGNKKYSSIKKCPKNKFPLPDVLIGSRSEGEPWYSTVSSAYSKFCVQSTYSGIQCTNSASDPVSASIIHQRHIA